MARFIVKRLTNTGKKRTWAWQKGKGLHPSNTQSKEEMKGREHKPKNPHILHATGDKLQPECTAKSNKHRGSRNGVKATKKQIQME